MAFKSAHEDVPKHISELRTVMSCCNIPKYVDQCGKKNSNLKEQFRNRKATVLLKLNPIKMFTLQ